MELKLSLVQMDVAASEPEQNLQKGEGFVAEAARLKSDLIVFPEMWTTGFQWDRNLEIAKSHEVYHQRVADLAKKYQIWINGSMLALNEEEKVSNTSILFNPKGEQVALYRKTHLFSYFHEEKHLAPGKCLTAAETPWGKVGLAVCYDLRFPELFRSYALMGCNMVLMPSAFPHPRLEHWKVLLRARAIENQMFVVAANQVGKEIVGGKEPVTFFGHSFIFDPWGETILEGGETEEKLLTATIDLSKVDTIRNKMKVLKDRRPEVYQL